MTSCAGLAFISISISIQTPIQIPVLISRFCLQLTIATYEQRAYIIA